MRAKIVKKPEQRTYNKGWQKIGIKAYDEDNIYPQRVRDAMKSSSTASSCLLRYISFLEGQGLANSLLASAEINPKGETWNAAVRQIARDLATFNGFALHVQYNAVAEITAFEVLHFEDLRLEEPDESGRVYRVAFHPDWSEQTTRANKVIKVTPANVVWFPTFDPRPNVVLSQIINAGGIEEYNGQILYVSMAGAFEYPVPIYDPCITPISTDEGIDNVLYKNARCNFLTAGAFCHKRGFGGSDEDEDVNEDGETFSDTLNQFQGDENALSVMDITIESDEDKPDFIKFRGENFDKEFTATREDTTTRIYQVFKQEPWLCILRGKVGFGGDVMADAYKVYNEETRNARTFINEALQRVFNLWSDRKSFPEGTETKIKPLDFSNI